MTSPDLTFDPKLFLQPLCDALSASPSSPLSTSDEVDFITAAFNAYRAVYTLPSTFYVWAMFSHIIHLDSTCERVINTWGWREVDLQFQMSKTEDWETPPGEIAHLVGTWASAEQAAVLLPELAEGEVKRKKKMASRRQKSVPTVAAPVDTLPNPRDETPTEASEKPQAEKQAPRSTLSEPPNSSPLPPLAPMHFSPKYNPRTLQTQIHPQTEEQVRRSMLSEPASTPPPPPPPLAPMHFFPRRKPQLQIQKNISDRTPPLILGREQHSGNRDHWQGRFEYASEEAVAKNMQKMEEVEKWRDELPHAFQFDAIQPNEVEVVRLPSGIYRPKKVSEARQKPAAVRLRELRSPDIVDFDSSKTPVQTIGDSVPVENQTTAEVEAEKSLDVKDIQSDSDIPASTGDKDTDNETPEEPEEVVPGKKKRKTLRKRLVSKLGRAVSIRKSVEGLNKLFRRAG